MNPFTSSIMLDVIYSIVVFAVILLIFKLFFMVLA